MNMRKILRQVAKQNGVSVAEVREEIQLAINVAWNKVPVDGCVIAAYQRQVPSRGEIPTPEELIRYTAAKVRFQG